MKNSKNDLLGHYSSHISITKFVSQKELPVLEIIIKNFQHLTNFLFSFLMLFCLA
uniref:Glutathione S-transferase n=1 Tax=Solanum tuberosum TaxID=4113 RepID=M0ZQ37_SOLTU